MQALWASLRLGLVADNGLVFRPRPKLPVEQIGFPGCDPILDGDIQRDGIAVRRLHLDVVDAANVAPVCFAGHFQGLDGAVEQLPLVDGAEVPVPAGAEILLHHPFLPEEAVLLDPHADLPDRDIHGERFKDQPTAGDYNDDDV